MTNNNKQNIFIEKASGEIEPFQEEKLRQSLKRADIPADMEDKALGFVKTRLYERIPTKEIYQNLTDFLGKSTHFGLLGRYRLKQAIMELGPTGYPFEKFMAVLLKRQGYAVQTGVVVRGKCVGHEIDVVAEKEGKHLMVECKFHNRGGVRTDVKVALYVKARFDDVANSFHQAWLVTNTKLTSDAIEYGECIGMKMIGWSYPPNESLQNLIEQTGLHPLTCLSSLSQGEKQKFLSQGVVLCRDLLEKEGLLIKTLKIPPNREQEIEKEIKMLCNL